MFGSMGQSVIKNLGNGGEMDGDVTITGDLTVGGGISLSVDEVIQGTSTIDVTNTEALLVRKNNDGGDVFVVDTTNSRVGIGTSSPTGALDIQSTDNLKLKFFNGTTFKAGLESVTSAGNMIATSAVNDFCIRSQSNLLFSAGGSTERMRIGSDGRVGIGTSNPNTKLDIVGSDFAGASLKIERTGDGENDDSALRFNRTGTVDANDRIGGIYFQDNDTSLALIRGEKIGTNDGRLDFIVPNGSAFSNTTNPVLTIQNDNVGIGTTSPTRQLTLAGAGSAIKIDSSDNAYIELDRGASSDVGQLKFMTGGSAKWYAGMADSGSTGFDGTEFFIGEGSGGASDAHFVIDASGNATFAGAVMINSSSANYADLTVGGTGDIVALRASSGTAGFTMYEGGTGRFNMTTLNGSGGIAFKIPSTTAMTIDSSGKVGIGTSSVNGVFTAFGTPMTAIGAQTVADIFGNAQQDADKGGGIGLGGRYITDSSSVTAFAEISGVKANNTNTNYEGEMVFKTRVNGGNLTERMRIDGSGNVGIGTSSPSSKLHVRETAGDEFFTFANGNGIGLVNNVASHGIGISASQSGSYGGQGSSALIVTEGGGSANAGTVQLVHDGTIGFTYKGGNVGIGRSTNIDKKLHILSSTSGDGITLEQSSVGSNTIRFEANSSTLRGLFGSEDSDGGAILSGSSGYSMVLRSEADIFLATNGNNEALKLDTNQNARFAGDVYIKNPTSNDPATLSLWSADTSIADNDNIGVILAQGSDSGGSPPYTGAKIEFNADAVWDTGTSNYYATRIDFFTQSNSGADTLANPALTIDSSQNATFAGNVKITKAESSASEFISALEINRDYGSATGTDLLTGMIFTDDNSVQAGIFTNRYNSAGNYNSRLQFYVNNSSSSMTPQTALGDPSMIIDENSRISLSNNDSGTSNTVFGKLAGDDLASGGNYNAFFGDNTGGNTTGDYNVAIGMQALKSLPDGDKNVAIGVNAMEAQDDTANGLNDCIAIGFEAFQGTNAGTSAPSGTVAIGSQSLKALTSGIKNTAIGYESGLATSAGSNNTYVGYEAGQGASGSENNNTGIGKQSLFAVTTAESNVAVGTNTLDELTTGGYNTAIGANALQGLDGGETENVAVGYNAGSNADGAINNICIGSNALLSTAAGDNQIVIGKDATGVANNSVTLGNASVTAVYMAQDSGASIFCGDILSGRASAGSTGNGHSIRSADSAIFSRDASGETVQVCRNADNGQFIQFRANGTIVGDIKNTGGTVSLTGFSGCHESSSSDTLEVGMVVSTIDEEHSENHAKVEISNTVGDKRVYGVVSDLEGLDGSNVTIASVGISSIKVTGSCVGGDLLESNGDGTAKVQSDDIIRSKTIGKVTMGNSTEEVKMVSCVLYCG